MSKKRKKKESKKQYDIQLFKYELIDKSKKGYTFKIPNDNKIVKVFFKEKRCNKTYDVLMKMKNHKEFPNVYYKEGNLFVMDEMKGLNLKKYIKTNGFTKDVFMKIMHLLEKMKSLKFQRWDIKMKNIYIDDSGNIMMMPYKNSLTKRIEFPMNLCKGFRKMGIIDEFLAYLKDYNKAYYDDWGDKVKQPLTMQKNQVKNGKKQVNNMKDKSKSFKEKFKDSINYGDFIEYRCSGFKDVDFVPFKI